jgi:peptidoglycan/LPS O-acetylase OafA/YrhL
MFVFVSGYVLGVSCPVLASARDVAGFLGRRWVRIMPLYVLALAAFGAISSGVRETLNPMSVLAHLLGLQLALASRAVDPVMTLWYVGLIVCYYLLYVVIARLPPSPWGMPLVVAAAGMLSVAAKYAFGVGDVRLALYLGPFAAGIGEARYRCLSRFGLRTPVLAAALLVAGVALYGARLHPLLDAANRPGLFSATGLFAFVLTNVVMVSCAALTYWAATSGAAPAAEGQDRMLGKVAYASYCVYLFHRPIWWGMTALWDPAAPVAKLAYLGLAGIPFIVLFGYHAQRAYDRLLAPSLRARLLPT